jgi:hypothetical protein
MLVQMDLTRRPDGSFILDFGFAPPREGTRDVVSHQLSDPKRVEELVLQAVRHITQEGPRAPHT